MCKKNRVNFRFENSPDFNCILSGDFKKIPSTHFCLLNKNFIAAAFDTNQGFDICISRFGRVFGRKVILRNPRLVVITTGTSTPDDKVKT